MGPGLLGSNSALGSSEPENTGSGGTLVSLPGWLVFRDLGKMAITD